MTDRRTEDSGKVVIPHALHDYFTHTLGAVENKKVGGKDVPHMGERQVAFIDPTHPGHDYLSDSAPARPARSFWNPFASRRP